MLPYLLPICIADPSPQMFLPSAAAARRKLILRRMDLSSHEERGDWSNIYQYSYREGFTGCIAQLEELEKYTKLIVGEQR